MSNKRIDEFRYFPKDAKLIKTDFAPEEKIQIVNKDDFPLVDMLSMTNLSDHFNLLGITDRDELKRRTAMFRFLRKHPKVGQELKYLQNPSYLSIPQRQVEFLDFYDSDRKHNPYWENLLEFVNIFNKYNDLPDSLANFISKLKESLSLEKEDNKFGEQVSKELQKSSVITGWADFSLSLSIAPRKNKKGQAANFLDAKSLHLIISKIKGYQAFSFALNDFQELELPDWCNSWWSKFLGITKWKEKKLEDLNAKRKKKAYESMLFKNSFLIRMFP